jgi:chemotaxis protein histidine kinase CheA
MAQGKIERPEISTFGDHEVITPPNRLAKAATKVKVMTPGDDPVARAEAALAQLSNEFSTWMHEECSRLDAARHKLKASGITKQNLDPLYHAAHDIKGEAATFGYPCVAPAADSLCRVLEHTPEIGRIPLPLVDQHVDAIRAIIREYARADVVQIAQALTQRLRQVTEEFLQTENRHRPEYLESVGSPTLVPGD